MAHDETFGYYSTALDEIFALRGLFAYEASLLVGHLGYKTFPPSRRTFADEQVTRMRAAARGHMAIALRDVPLRSISGEARNIAVHEVTAEWWEANHSPAGPHGPADGFERSHYVRALHCLDQMLPLMAYEARVLEAHQEMSSRFPKLPKRVITEQVARMRDVAARPGASVDWTTSKLDSSLIRWAMDDADAAPTLTRYQWEVAA